MNVCKSSQLNFQHSSSGTELVESIRGLSFSPDIINQPYLLELLLYCDKSRTIFDACDFLKALSKSNSTESCMDSIKELINVGILELSDMTRSHSDKNLLSKWEANGWGDALDFHIHTNNLEKTNYSVDPKGLADKQLMKNYLNSEPSPSAYKCNSSAQTVELIPYSKTGMTAKSVTQIFNDNVAAIRERDQIEFKEFSWYMHLAFGQTGTKNLPVTGEHVKKTIPSGGSRHTTEVYVAVLSVEDIPPGLYHYCVLHHTLEMIKAGDFSDFMRQHIITHPSRPAFKYNAGFIFSTLFERSMFRYRESRSYRVMQFDLGHVMQNAAMLASAINRSSYRGYSFHDQQVDNFLEIDQIKESAMTFMLLG